LNPRIAIAGAEATGKTALAHALGAALDVEVVTDPRPALLEASGCHTLFEAAKFSPVWAALLEQQLKSEEKVDRGVFDTCAVDCWAMLQRWGWCGIAPVEVERLYQSTVSAAMRFTHVLLMPAIQIAAPGGARFVNPDYAHQIDRLIRAFIRDAGLETRVIDVSAGAVEERAAAVLRRVRS